MIRGMAKIRAAIALVLLSVPYLLLFAAGSLWLFQNRLLLAWAALGLACTAAGWYLLRGLLSKAEPPRVQPDLSWPPQGLEAWQEVEQLAAEIEGEELPLERPETFVALVRRVAEVVARHYHPDAADPWLETPLPHVLRIVELVARDLRRASLGYVPGSHILTIGDLRRLRKLAGMAHRSYFWYRIASLLINTPAAFLREARDAVFGRLTAMSTETARRWAVGYFVRRTGYYAIQLYGGQLVLDDTQPDDAPLRQSKRDAGEDIAADSPCSTRSRFASSSWDRRRRASRASSTPCSASIAPRPTSSRGPAGSSPTSWQREGLQQAIVLDTAGYDTASPAEMLRPLVDQSARLRHGGLRLFGRFRRAGGRPPFPQRTAGRIPAEPGPPFAGGDYGPDAHRSAASAPGVGPALSARSGRGSEGRADCRRDRGRGHGPGAAARRRDSRLPAAGAGLQRRGGLGPGDARAPAGCAAGEVRALFAAASRRAILARLMAADDRRRAGAAGLDRKAGEVAY